MAGLHRFWGQISCGLGSALEHAIVEDIGGAAAHVDGRQYAAQAKRLAAQLRALQTRAMSAARPSQPAGTQPACAPCKPASSAVGGGELSV